MSREDFYQMRPGEFWEALLVYQEDKAADRRHLGELIRGAALRLWNIQVSKRSRILDARKFWPMPWDEISGEDAAVKAIKEMTDEERRKSARRLLKKFGWNE